MTGNLLSPNGFSAQLSAPEQAFPLANLRGDDGSRGRAGVGAGGESGFEGEDVLGVRDVGVGDGGEIELGLGGGSGWIDDWRLLSFDG